MAVGAPWTPGNELNPQQGGNGWAGNCCNKGKVALFNPLVSKNKAVSGGKGKGIMERKELPHQRIVYVCLNERDTGACCARGGSELIHSRLKDAIKALGLNRKVRISRSGCMNQCGQGPNILIFPDNIWLSGVTEADVDKILEMATQDINEQ